MKVLTKISKHQRYMIREQKRNKRHTILHMVNKLEHTFCKTCPRNVSDSRHQEWCSGCPVLDVIQQTAKPLTEDKIACQEAVLALGRDMTMTDVLELNANGMIFNDIASALSMSRTEMADLLDMYRAGLNNDQTPLVPCSSCGALMYRSKQRRERNKNHFCSNICKSEYMKNNTLAEKAGV